MPAASKFELPTIKRGTVGGVPTVWAAVDGPSWAMLRFRSGRADETLRTNGVNHVIEHLALSTIDRRSVSFNGWVSLLTTTFVAQGERADVKSFVAQVCDALHNLPLDRLAGELRVLKTEAAQRPSTTVDALLRCRYGASGYGLSWYREFGFDTLTAHDVQAHAREWFTADNAVLMLTGSPRGWSLELPAGAAKPIPEAAEVVHGPGVARRSDTGVLGATWLTERVPASATHTRLVEKRVIEHLRHDEALVYSVGTNNERAGAKSHVSLASEALKDHRRQAASAFERVLHDTTTKPFTKAELQADQKLARQSLRTPNSAATMGWLDRASEELLRNGEVTQPADVVARGLRVTLDEVQECAESMRDSLLLSLPNDANVTIYQAIEKPKTPVLAGKTYYAQQGVPKTAPRLVIGDAGISLLKNDDVLSLYWRDLVGVMSLNDGTRVLIAKDASSIQVRRRGWLRPEHVIKMIDARLDSAVVIPLDEADRTAPTGPWLLRSEPLPRIAFVSLLLTAAVLLFVLLIAAPTVGAPVAAAATLRALVVVRKRRAKPKR